MPSIAKEEVLPAWGLAAAGSAGAIVANALVYPLDIVKTRLQVQGRKLPGAVTDPEDHHYYESAVHALQKIFEKEGVSGLYSGLAGSLLGVGTTNFAYFYWYSAVRGLYFSSEALGAVQRNPSIGVELSLGAVAGALAQLFTIPIAVVTTRQQTQKKSERKGMLATAKEVIESEDGYSGLWRGMKASLVLVVNPSITYGAYQRLKQLMYPHKTSLRPHEAFLLGAMSKALATLVTQPLIVAKVRLQSKPPPDRQGKPFKSFTEILKYTIEHEGFLSLWKGLGPQLVKAVIVQGLLMMTKERMELLFMLLFAYVRRIRKEKLQKLAELAASKAREVAPAASAQVAKLTPAILK